MFLQSEMNHCSVVQLSAVFVSAVNTHMHADHVTGTGMIKRQIPTCKSVISKHTEAKADRYVENGELIEFGKFSLECRMTPGHTDCECVCVVDCWSH